MASTRFQIYLTPDQYNRLRSLSKSKNQPIAALIRDAVDQFLDRQGTKNLTQDPLWKIIGSSHQTRKVRPCPDLHATHDLLDSAAIEALIRKDHPNFAHAAAFLRQPGFASTA